MNVYFSAKANLKLAIAAALFFLFGVSSVFAVVQYSVTDLGSLGGLTHALSINASGQVVGDSFLPQRGPDHAFLWTPTTSNGVLGSMQDLGTLGEASFAYGINDSGQIVGRSYQGGQERATLFDGTLHDLGFGGSAYAINNAGQIAAEMETRSGSLPVIYDSVTHNITTLSNDGYRAYGINEAGDAAGWGLFDSGGSAFLYDGTTHNLGALGAHGSIGLGINDSDEVVGYSYSSTDPNHQHAFLYDGAMHDLGTLGEQESFARSINNFGFVVGSSTTSSSKSKAFIYSQVSGMVDLNTEIDPASGWSLQYGEAINDRGQIVGEGTLNGVTRAFLLTPLPEQRPGDFNGDLKVDAADYLTWRQFGGTIANYNTWRAHFGESFASASNSTAAVPEPFSLVLAVSAFVGLLAINRKR